MLGLLFALIISKIKRNCVDNIFAMNSGECHVCNRVLRKNNFREQIYDNPLINRETFLRRKLRKIYNLKQDDFTLLKEFGDYQERRRRKTRRLSRTPKRLDELQDSNVAAEVILDRERKRIEKEFEEKDEQQERKKRNKDILQARKRAAENMSFNTNHIVSHIERVACVLPWIIFSICAFLGFFLFIVPWCFCCDPFFLEQILDVNHSCPVCKKFLGRFSWV